MQWNTAEKKGSSVGSYLANPCPEKCLLDIGRRLIVPAEESHWWFGLLSLGRFEQIGEDCINVGGVADIGRIRRGPNQEKMIAESVVDLLGRDALVHGDLLGGWAVRDADIEEASLEVLDAVGGVAGVPGYLEWILSVVNGVLDEGIGECYLSKSVSEARSCKLVARVLSTYP